MPAALPIPIRKEIVERRTRGETFRQIAREMDLSYDTVRTIWQHWQCHNMLEPNYKACSQRGPRKPAVIVQAAVAMKREHPGWGAGLIRLYLSEAYEAADVPSERTLQRWFRRAGLQRSPVVQQPRQPVQRGQVAHEVWAIDAKEKMRLQDGSSASWLTISDEASGAILHTAGFPPGLIQSGRSPASTPPASDDDAHLGQAAEDAL